MQATRDIGDYTLESGVRLRNVQVAYAAYGTLNDQGDNAILACHGYTAGPSMLAHGGTTGEGSWAPLIGPGKPLDTDRYYIVCANMLGSSYGSTGPASINPETGKRYGIDFPDFTMGDIVGVQKRLLDSLHVTALKCVVGPSLGGFQAQQWALDYADMVQTIGVIVSGPDLPDTEHVDMDDLLAQLSANPAWNGGRYDDVHALIPTLSALRLETLRTYGMDAVLIAAGHSQTEREAIMTKMAEQWASSFDACSLVHILKAAKRFNISDRLSSIKADILFVMSDSDVLFPPSPTILDTYRALHGHRRPAEVFSMDTPFGHQASGPAHAQWSDGLRRLLEG